MSQDPTSPQDSISPDSSIMQLENALVLDKSPVENASRYLTVSYTALTPDGFENTETLRLILDIHTLTIDAFGIQVDFSDIQIAALINAQFSPNITSQNPPEALAYLIVVRQPHALPESLITTDWVASIDTAKGLLYTGNPNSINSQKRFVVSDATQITNSSGNPVPLYAIRPGHIVRITHAPFHEGCIPPQATAYAIQQF